MTASHRSQILTILVVTLAAISLAGCISSKQTTAFKYAFLPATPAADQPTFEEPPRINAQANTSTTPSLPVQRYLAVGPGIPEVDARIVKAEDRFEVGKRLQQSGDSMGARREFDAA